jgi:hypothetical protein
VKLLSLPQPPNPDDGRYKGSPYALAKANYLWFQQIVGILQDNSRVNDAPCASPVLSTDNVATVIGALTQKGILSPTTSRNSST